jgi:hypothetical protein
MAEYRKWEVEKVGCGIRKNSKLTEERSQKDLKPEGGIN